MIYADHAATTFMLPKAKDAMLEVLDSGNPSSLHRSGRAARELVENSRKKIAEMLGVPSKTIYFTSGGTEANNTVLFGVSPVYRSPFEHKSVTNCSKKYKDGIFTVKDGRVDTSNAAWNISSLFEGQQVAVMTASNETGVIQPIEEIGEYCRKRNVYFHTDAVQAMGHIPVPIKNVDSLSASAHKFGGAKGVGFLYSRKPVFPLIRGGYQENGVRAGTENVAGIVSMAAALEDQYEYMAERSQRTKLLADALIKGLTLIDGVKINGSADRNNHLPGIVSATFCGLDGATIALMLDAAGICVSTGSACNAGSDEPSAALKALGLTDEEINGTVRFSLSHTNTLGEIFAIVEEVVRRTDALKRRKTP